MQKLPITLSILAIGISCIALFKQYGGQADSVQASEEPEVHEFDLVAEMMKLQWLMNKLWFAGNGGNRELVDFYVHEIEEKMEDFAKSGAKYEKRDLGPYMRAHGLSAIEQCKSSIEESGLDDFQGAYKQLMSGCNSCHFCTDHGFIKITIPTHPIADNQSFE